MSDYSPTGLTHAVVSGSEGQYQAHTVGQSFSQYPGTYSQDFQSSAPSGYNVEGYLHGWPAHHVQEKSYNSRPAGQTPTSNMRNEYDHSHPMTSSMYPTSTTTALQDRQLPAPISTRHSVAPNGSTLASPTSTYSTAPYSQIPVTAQHLPGCHLANSAATHSQVMLPTLAQLAPGLNPRGSLNAFYGTEAMHSNPTPLQNRGGHSTQPVGTPTSIGNGGYQHQYGPYDSNNYLYDVNYSGQHPGAANSTRNRHNRSSGADHRNSGGSPPSSRFSRR